MTAVFLIVWTVAILTLAWLGLRLRRHYLPPRELRWEDVLTQAQRGGYQIITTDELARCQRQNPHDLLLVDTREPGEFAAGHIAGAVNFPLPPTRWARWQARRLLAHLLGPDKARGVVFY